MTRLSDLLLGLKDDLPARKPFLTGTRSVSYGALRDQIARTRGLLQRLGISAGSRVAIASADEEAVSVLYGACLTTGVAAVMIDPAASAVEATLLLGASKPSAVFADDEFVERARDLQRDDTVTVFRIGRPDAKRSSFGLIIRKSADAANTFPAVLKEETPRPALDVDEGATALILFTSGTTSKPKGVELSYGNLAAQMQTFQTHFGLHADCRIENHLPLHHSDGLNQGPLLVAACGGTWVRPEPVKMQTLGAMLDLGYRERATHYITVPTVLAMADGLPAGYDDSFAYPEFRFIESTAGFLDEVLWRRIEERFGVTVVNCYGLTETVNEALYCGPDAGSRRVGTVGKPVGCQARIVDEQGDEVSPGEQGELVLCGDIIMKGYFEDMAASEAVLRNGWLTTGDLARRDEEGFFHIVGRKKNVIIRGGFNVYPEDVNAALVGHEQIAAAATMGLPDPILGERAVSCVVASDGSDGLDIDEIFVHLRKVLGAERVPNTVLLFDNLPYGPSGKVELQKLRSMIEQRENGLSNSDRSARNAEQFVFDTAASAFHVPIDTLLPTSSDENTPGWDSLSFLELIMALERQLGMRLDPRDVMNIETLADIVDIVDRESGRPGAPAG